LPRRPAAGRRPAPDLRRAEIRLEAVHFAHPGRTPLLRGASLALRPGERVALVGPSGSGKTTLVAVLLGLLHPDRGRVVAGGQPLAETCLERWREQIAWVPQRPALFHGTVADNVREGCSQATVAEVREALDAAGLDLPLDAPVGERGGQLSAGQRQRVAIARALVRGAPLLVLDEPTANLDVRSRDELARLLRSGHEGTVLLVTHSPALAAAAERVVRLEAGRLVDASAAAEAAR
jgi:ABC-type multidrug transport system fused ATPase/permease subunit